MAVYTDSPAVAMKLLQLPPTDAFVPCPTSTSPAPLLHAALFSGIGRQYSSPLQVAGWDEVLVRETAPGSQYDTLIELVRAGASIPDRCVCIAGEGTGFHGFRGRSWSALRGNIHLAVHLAPRRRVPRFETVFTALAAVSLVDAIDEVPGLRGRARIKWVNDVLVDGAKVGGVLAYTHSQADVVNAVVLGIGLNVEAAPRVERSRFVPQAGALCDHAAGGPVQVGTVLRLLLESLARNYDTLLTHGYQRVMERYRAMSAVLGQHVTICSESGEHPGRIIARGRVRDVGDGLELHLAGTATPVRTGRLLLGTVSPEAIT